MVKSVVETFIVYISIVWLLRSYMPAPEILLHSTHNEIEFTDNE